MTVLSAEMIDQRMSAVEQELVELRRAVATAVEQVVLLDDAVESLEDHQVRFRTVVLPAVATLIEVLVDGGQHSSRTAE